MSRIERDRALFERSVKDQLAGTISQANPRLVAGAVVKAVELQIVTEEIAREKGFEIDEEVLAEYVDQHREFVAREVDKALSAFICAIVSQEG